MSDKYQIFSTTTLRRKNSEAMWEKKFTATMAQLGKEIANGGPISDAVARTLMQANSPENHQLLGEVLDYVLTGHSLYESFKKKVSWEYRILLRIGDKFPDAMPGILCEFPNFRLARKRFDDFELFVCFCLGCTLVHVPVTLEKALEEIQAELEKTSIWPISKSYAFSIFKIRENLKGGQDLHGAFCDTLHDDIDENFQRRLENTHEMSDAQLGKHLKEYASNVMMMYNRFAI